MDILTDVLNALELKGWLSSRRELAPPWRYDFAESKDSMFHVLSFGGAFLQVEGEAEPRRVEDGDVVLFPTGHPHSLYDDPASPLTRLVHLDYNPQRERHIVGCEGAGPKLLMLCGAFHFEYPNYLPLLHRLPKLIHIPGAQGRMDQGFARYRAADRPRIGFAAAGHRGHAEAFDRAALYSSHPALDRRGRGKRLAGGSGRCATSPSARHSA